MQRLMLGLMVGTGLVMATSALAEKTATCAKECKQKVCQATCKKTDCAVKCNQKAQVDKAARRVARVDRILTRVKSVDEAKFNELTELRKSDENAFDKALKEYIAENSEKLGLKQGQRTRKGQRAKKGKASNNEVKTECIGN